MLESYARRSFGADCTVGRITHDVYARGSDKGATGATVVIIQELPGIGPETISLANEFAAKGFNVVLPHLFGPLGKVSMVGNLVRVFCMRREFRLFEKNASSPVVDWLKALCRDLKDNHGATGVGVIGNCLTGNFALSLMADESVLAGVASQPSMPLNDQDALHMSADEVAAARARLDSEGAMMALRFENDRLCTAAKFRAIGHAFNDDGSERVRLVTLPGKGHSVLTLDLIKGGEPAAEALAQVFRYFGDKLGVAV